MSGDVPATEHAYTQPLLRTLLLVLIGPLVWATHLLIIYGATTIVCSRTLSETALPAIIVAASFIALTVLCATAIMSARTRALRSQPFLRRVSLTLSLLSVIGIFWAGSTVTILPACRSMP
ncbi:hypothetical protein DFP91_2873 [Pseudorhodoplanes sinuspersici]|nr:hypothetical protein DFP91_2873 [Pseudorhodoplanes sinuspersici]